MGELRYPDVMNCAAELLDTMVGQGNGDRIALRFPGGTWTYRELLEHSNRIAHVLTRDLGLVPGNRVLLRGPNNPMMAACWFAVLKAGGIVVATMPLLRTRELAYLLDRAQVAIALTDARIADALDEAARGAKSLRHVMRFGGGAEPPSLEAHLARKPADFETVSTAADDVALIAFTSGTTGGAKGTMHFHRDILACADTFARHVLRPGRDDLFCGSPPFAFTYGLGGLIMFPMRIGAASLLLEQASPPQLLDGIRTFGATICFTAPTAYRALVEEAARGGVGSLRRCVSAGETLPRATFEAWHQATGIRIIDGIGSTEMLHIFISAADDDIRPGSPGRAVPGYRAIVLGDDGREAPRHTVGRLAVRGPTGCRYLDDAERQRGYVVNGWNVTGDAYIEDEQGYFWYQARTDDMIISGGYNIAGPEVENVLLEHALVKECAVIGIADEQRGQVVKAVVVLHDGTAASLETVKALQDHVKAQIAPYKY
ncbi:MAG TPA: AMP-binding protein, partial [Gemmatimonadaceae bacterium]|nr:AMP-binding protein [Gemmatimonadaceae bacterium]